MFGWLKKWFRPTRTITAETVRAYIKARYDAAQTNDENTRHWQAADALSARGANSLDVRKVLRERARYERDNNGYCLGTVDTLANDTIGVGPRLQLGSDDTELNNAVETRFAEWCEETSLVEKLHILKQAKTVDGEGFGVFVNNPALEAVQLDIATVECDQVTTPWQSQARGLALKDGVDGVEVNRLGNPTFYHVLKEHPSDAVSFGTTFDRIPATDVLHWFRKRRPGQLRGIPEITAGLPLFAYLRRFTLATLSAAEIAAAFAAMLESTAAADATTDDPTPFETLEIERGMLTVSPTGWKMNQLKSEHPSTTYDMFETAILRQIGRGINTPLNVISGDSSRYNFSSARLDSFNYRGSVRVERFGCERICMNRVYRAWLGEGLLIRGYLPAAAKFVKKWKWNWPGWEYIDPMKDARADATRLAIGTTTKASICAEHGEDWEETTVQRGKEVALDKANGLPSPMDAAGKPVKEAGPTPAGGADVSQQIQDLIDQAEEDTVDVGDLQDVLDSADPQTPEAAKAALKKPLKARGHNHTRNGNGKAT